MTTYISEMESGNQAAGYLTDLGNLIERFQALRTMRYKQYSEIWKSLEFYKIFYGRKLEHDRAELIEIIYQITLRFLTNERVSFGRNIYCKRI